MKSFFAYEMQYTGKAPVITHLPVIPFHEKYYPQYERVYNECFYEMRKALDIKPYHFYSDISQLGDKAANLFLLLQGETLIGSVGCYDTEIDDLIVNQQFRNNGYGTALLQWAICHIRAYADDPITLHAADWNKNVIRLYLKNGFTVTKKERVN